MDDLPPDLSRLGGQLTTAIDDSLRRRRFFRSLLHRIATAGGVGALLFVGITAAPLHPRTSCAWTPGAVLHARRAAGPWRTRAKARACGAVCRSTAPAATAASSSPCRSRPGSLSSSAADVASASRPPGTSRALTPGRAPATSRAARSRGARAAARGSARPAGTWRTARAGSAPPAAPTSWCAARGGASAAGEPWPRCSPSPRWSASWWLVTAPLRRQAASEARREAARQAATEAAEIRRLRADAQPHRGTGPPRRAGDDALEHRRALVDEGGGS